MLILLSPAKTLDFTTPVAETGTTARFASEAGRIARAAAKLRPDQLARLMRVSDKLAALTAERFGTFDEALQRPAIRAFAGDVYRGFDAASASAATIDFAQQHLRILSGLYGLLRPLDNIRPHRLEMGTHWSPAGDCLVSHWGTRIARALVAELRQHGSKTLLNLASNEYFAAVGPHLPAAIRVVTPRFQVMTDAGPRFHSFAAKVARGRLARFACDGGIVEPSALASFGEDGWGHVGSDSKPDSPLFVRH